MDDNFVQLRIVYDDLPDLIELEIIVRYRGWSAHSSAYASPSAFADEAGNLLSWVQSPSEPCSIRAGADTGIGWMVLKFFTIDRAGHARCHVKLATGKQARDSRPEETWRIEIEIATELGLIENFARECVALSEDFSRGARLTCLPAS
jgi:hypothetical protein